VGWLLDDRLSSNSGRLARTVSNNRSCSATGTADQAVLYANMQRSAAKLSHAIVITVDGGGHFSAIPRRRDRLVQAKRSYRDGEIRTRDPLLPKDIRGSEVVIGERGRPQEQADSGCPKVLSCGHIRELVRPWCVLESCDSPPLPSSPEGDSLTAS
jgi:hypothetical protein